MIPAILPTYARAELTFERGEGAYLFSTDGRKYLDFGSGVAVTALGHSHPHLVEALTAQAQRLWHCSNLYQIAPQQRAAERLVAASLATPPALVIRCGPRRSLPSRAHVHELQSHVRQGGIQRRR